MRIKRKTLPVADRLRGALASVHYDNLLTFFNGGPDETQVRFMLEGKWSQLGTGFKRWAQITTSITPVEPDAMRKELAKYGVVIIEENTNDGLVLFLAQIRGKWYALVNILGTEEIKVLGEIRAVEDKENPITALFNAGKEYFRNLLNRIN